VVKQILHITYYKVIFLKYQVRIQKKPLDIIEYLFIF